jgi:chemotaxis signal transduction protein
MINDLKINSPWVLAEINKVVYAISCESVLSLNQVPPITSLPTAPKEVRGVINFRTKLIQLVDTRILLGIKSIVEEINDFSNMMDQRYKDHTNWIETLEQSILLDTEFTLTTDPHKCAFGKWYDNYKPENSNIMFLSTFAKFDAPHKAIHKIGITAKDLIDAEKKEEATNLIKSVRDTELKQMLHLFEDIKDAYSESRIETIVVLGDENNCIGLSVDKITAIEHLFEIDENFIKESITSTEYLSGVAKRKDGMVVLILNDEYILSKYHR